MSKKTLLIELGTEELPPKSLRKLGEAFGLSIRNSLKESELIENTCAGHDLLAAPRRLAFLIDNVLAPNQTQKLNVKDLL